MYEYGKLPHKLSKEESIPVALEIIEIAKSKMNGYVLSEDNKEEYYLK